MKRIIALTALAGLTACAYTYESYPYEVTQRLPEDVRVQTMAGVEGLKGEALEEAWRHMDGMATQECRRLGKSKAVYRGDRRFQGGPYNAWIERIYRCA